MPVHVRHLAVIAALALLASGLSGCGTINEKLSGVSDYVPQWMGGEPSDVPPRPGTAKYEEFMKEREQKRLERAPPRQDTTQSPSSGPVAVY